MYLCDTAWNFAQLKSATRQILCSPLIELTSLLGWLCARFDLLALLPSLLIFEVSSKFNALDATSIIISLIFVHPQQLMTIVMISRSRWCTSRVFRHRKWIFSQNLIMSKYLILFKIEIRRNKLIDKTDHNFTLEHNLLLKPWKFLRGFCGLVLMQRNLQSISQELPKSRIWNANNFLRTSLFELLQKRKLWAAKCAAWNFFVRKANFI